MDEGILFFSPARRHTDKVIMFWTWPDLLVEAIHTHQASSVLDLCILKLISASTANTDGGVEGQGIETGLVVVIQRCRVLCLRHPKHGNKTDERA